MVYKYFDKKTDSLADTYNADVAAKNEITS